MKNSQFNAHDVKKRCEGKLDIALQISFLQISLSPLWERVGVRGKMAPNIMEKTFLENYIAFKGRHELNGWFVLDDKKVARITVPHGRKFVPPKTYKSMATQLKLSIDEFDDLLECPLDRQKYESIIKP